MEVQSVNTFIEHSMLVEDEFGMNRMFIRREAGTCTTPIQPCIWYIVDGLESERRATDVRLIAMLEKAYEEHMRLTEKERM